MSRTARSRLALLTLLVPLALAACSGEDPDSGASPTTEAAAGADTTVDTTPPVDELDRELDAACTDLVNDFNLSTVDDAAARERLAGALPADLADEVALVGRLGEREPAEVERSVTAQQAVEAELRRRCPRSFPDAG